MSSKQILSHFFSLSYWQARTHLLVVAVCLFLGLLGQMPDSSAGWVLPIKNPLGTSCLRKPTKGHHRRRWRYQMRLAKFKQDSYQLSREYLEQSYLLFGAYTLFSAVFLALFAPAFMSLALLPLLLAVCRIFSLLYPHWGRSPEILLLERVLSTSSQALLLLAMSVFALQMMNYFISSFDDRSVLFVAAFKAGESKKLEPTQTVNQSQLKEDTVSRNREAKLNKKSKSRKVSKRICLPIDKEQYAKIVSDSKEFRKFIDSYIKQFPELFPNDITDGYKLHDKLPKSKKMPEVTLRRIKLKKKDKDQKAQVFTIAPSFVMPYMRGYSDDISDALFLHSKFGVSYWGLTHVFGRNDMYWYRLMQSFSRNSIVGTTVKNADKLPKDVLADEKHSKINGNKTYIATTVADDCILGASISLSAGKEGLTEAYGHFKDEAAEIDSQYEVESVNTDGWSATVCAWKSLYSEVKPVRCFLHGFIKIRSCAKKHPLFCQISQKVWEAYRQEDKESFLSSVGQLQEWASQNLSGSALDSILKLCKRADEYALAYDHPTAYRTSNMIDRHMEPMA